MRDDNNIPSDLEDEAAEWVLKLSEGLSREEEQALDHWLKSNPSAQTILDGLSGVWDSCDILDPCHFELTEVDDSLEQASGLQRSRGRWRSFTIAAVAAVAMFSLSVGLVKTFVAPDGETGEQRLFEYATADFYELEDGSTVDLNEGAELTCVYSAERREFWVKSGEVYFTVAKDPNRPFDVYAGETKLQALGTQFNVKYRNDSVEVLVTEGLVSLAVLESKAMVGEQRIPDADLFSANLSRNHKAVFHHDEATQTGIVVEEVREEVVAELLEWKPVTLEFDSMPLPEVAKAFNRYNETQIVIADSRIEALEIVATFRSNKLEGFINLLQTTSNVLAEREGDTIILSSRN